MAVKLLQKQQPRSTPRKAKKHGEQRAKIFTAISTCMYVYVHVVRETDATIWNPLRIATLSFL